MSVLARRRTTAGRRRAAPGSADPYGDLIAAAAPIAWYRANGSAADAISGGSSGTLFGTVYGTGILPARPSAQTFNVDGIDDYVSIPNQSKLNLTGNFSFEAWLVANTLTGFGSIAVKSGESNAYGIQHNGTSIGVTFRGATNTNLYSPAAIITGTLYHVTGVLDAGTARIYVNGVQTATAASAVQSTSTGALRIGSWDGTQEFFDGRVAEVAIYNRVLTATEITEHYTAGTTP